MESKEFSKEVYAMIKKRLIEIKEEELKNAETIQSFFKRLDSDKIVNLLIENETCKEDLKEFYLDCYKKIVTAPIKKKEEKEYITIEKREKESVSYRMVSMETTFGMDLLKMSEITGILVHPNVYEMEKDEYVIAAYFLEEISGTDGNLKEGERLIEILEKKQEEKDAREQLEKAKEEGITLFNEKQLKEKLPEQIEEYEEIEFEVYKRKFKTFRKFFYSTSKEEIYEEYEHIRMAFLKIGEKVDIRQEFEVIYEKLRRKMRETPIRIENEIIHMDALENFFFSVNNGFQCLYTGEAIYEIIDKEYQEEFNLGTELEEYYILAQFINFIRIAENGEQFAYYAKERIENKENEKKKKMFLKEMKETKTEEEMKKKIQRKDKKTIEKICYELEQEYI